MTEEDQATELTDQALKRVRSLEVEIQRAVIGQRQVVREVVIGLLAAGHVMVEG